MTDPTQFAPGASDPAHHHLRKPNDVLAAILPSTIALSWQRCTSIGPSDKSIEFTPCASSVLRTKLEAHSELISHATPVMEMLHKLIDDSHRMIVLTNGDGLILHSFGDDAFLERADRVSMAPGISWAEDEMGTNAIGTALIEERPLSIHGTQHYFSTNHVLTCSAAPILDPFGKISGVLDVTGSQHNYNSNTLALVKMSVRLVEDHMFAHAFPDAMVIHLHTRPEHLGSICEGMIAFSPQGQLIAANQNACSLLKISQRDIPNTCFEQIFSQPFKTALAYTTQANKLPLQLTDTRGVPIYCFCVVGSSMRTPFRVFTFPRADKASASARANSAPPISGTPAHGCALDVLDTGDHQIKAVIQKVRRVIGRDIPILINGETGVGKELFARAIHDDGPRRDKPFIAVNCAAIPEGLIESELFGYEEGAFTGAKRGGSFGKLLQVQGGTLFLDEIGDMPHALQARLLRVLQERIVNPLGSNKSIPVDISLVCATHRKIKDRVAAGKFREDLYYRLNGLTVNLPALRVRSDLPALTKVILSRLTPDSRRIGISAKVMKLFRRHTWPGNIRQLSNILRTAVVMADEGKIIGIQHLPDDFFDEFEKLEQNSRKDADFDVTAEEPAAAAFSSGDKISRVMLSSSDCLQTTTLGLIQQALERHQGNVSAAARQLGVSRNTLYRKMRQIWNL